MKDPFKRGIYAYLGFTASLWLIAYAMQSNGSAVLRNPSWIMVSKLKFIFTFGLCLAMVITICGWILGHIEYENAQKKLKFEELESERIEEKFREIRFQHNQSIKIEKEIEDQEREKRRQELLKIEVEKKLSEMRSRSAKDAAHSSLDSFLN